MSLTLKIKEYLKQTSIGERVTGAIFVLIALGILFAQWKAWDDGYLRYVTIAITLIYTVAALFSAKELCARLERAKNSDNKTLPEANKLPPSGFAAWWKSFGALKEKKETPETETRPLSVLKALWKLHSEYLSVAALLGFGITQYRVALELDNFIAQKNGAGDPAFTWAFFQSIILVGLLMLATLVISRKLALAKFEYKEAVEKFEASQRKNAVDENRDAEDLAREALNLAQEAVQAAQKAEATAKQWLEQVRKAKASAVQEAEGVQTATVD